MSARAMIVSAYGTDAGGAELWLLGILDNGALQRSGWELEAIVLQSGPLQSAFQARGIAAITYAVPASPMGIAARAAGLRRAILCRAPDVVICNGVKAQLAVSMALPGRRPPTIWVKHDHSYDRLLAGLLGRHADTVVATATEVGAPTRRRDVVVIEPPRPPEPTAADQAREILQDAGWTEPTPLTLGMATRLVPYKGVDLAIRALADPRCDSWSLLVIGDNDPSTPGERRRLLDLAADLAVSERVCLTGAIPSAGRLLGAVDAVGVLTRPGEAGAPTKEGYGIVATEAMLAGVPVIVAQEGPISRRLTTAEGPAGITLAAPTPDDLAGALSVLSDPGMREQMGRRGAGVAHRLPDEDDVARALADVLAPFRSA